MILPAGSALADGGPIRPLSQVAAETDVGLPLGTSLVDAIAPLEVALVSR
jgi:hypothetical protein